MRFRILSYSFDRSIPFIIPESIFEDSDRENCRCRIPDTFWNRMIASCVLKEQDAVNRIFDNDANTRERWLYQSSESVNFVYEIPNDYSLDLFVTSSGTIGLNSTRQLDFMDTKILERYGIVIEDSLIHELLEIYTVYEMHFNVNAISYEGTHEDFVESGFYTFFDVYMGNGEEDEEEDRCDEPEVIRFPSQIHSMPYESMLFGERKQKTKTNKFTEKPFGVALFWERIKKC